MNTSKIQVKLIATLDKMMTHLEEILSSKNEVPLIQIDILKQSTCDFYQLISDLEHEQTQIDKTRSSSITANAIKNNTQARTETEACPSSLNLDTNAPMTDTCLQFINQTEEPFQPDLTSASTLQPTDVTSSFLDPEQAKTEKTEIYNYMENNSILNIIPNIEMLHEKIEVEVETHLDPNLEVNVEDPLDANLEMKIETSLDTNLEVEVETHLTPNLEVNVEDPLDTNLEMKIETSLDTNLEMEVENHLTPNLEVNVEDPLDTNLEMEIETSLDTNLEMEVENHLTPNSEVNVEDTLDTNLEIEFDLANFDEFSDPLFWNKQEKEEVEAQKILQEAETQKMFIEEFGEPELFVASMAELSKSTPKSSTAMPHTTHLLNRLKTMNESNKSQNTQENINNPLDIFSSLQTIADKYNNTTQTINDQASTEQHSTLNFAAEKSNISDLKSAIGINEKFLFINDLFKGNMKECTDMILQLNEAENIEKAFEILTPIKEKYHWEEMSLAYVTLMDFVARRFHS